MTKKRTISESEASPKRMKKQGGSPKPRGQKSGKTARKTAASGRRGRIIRVSIALTGAILFACIWCFDISRAVSNAMMPTISKGDLVLSWAPLWPKASLTPGGVALTSLEDGKSGDYAPNYLRVMARGEAEVAFNADRIDVNGESAKRLALSHSEIDRGDLAPEIWRETLKSGRHYRIMLPSQGLVGRLSGQMHVGSDEYFVVGDNRLASYDSRQSGPAAAEQIKGKALVILESTRHDGIFGSWLKFFD